MQTISSLSRETITVPLLNGLSGATDPQIAVVRIGTEPAEADWQTATVDGDNLTLLVGPGGTVELADGMWAVWVRLTVGPERPVERTGVITVY